MAIFTKEIIVNGKSLTIKKLPLRRYAELLEALQELPKNLDLIKGKSQNEIIASLPQLITVCYPDVERTLIVITELTKEEIGELGLDDVVKIADAFLTINNYGEIIETIKKVQFHPTVPVKTEEKIKVTDPGTGSSGL